MNGMDSENFPRGCRKVVPDTKVNGKRKHEDNLFSTSRESKQKKARKEKIIPKETVSDATFQSLLTTQGTLSYNKLQDGMIVLASVRRITNLAIQLEFPGLAYGHATINNVSDTFTKIISEQLQKGEIQEPSTMLKSFISVGQLVPAKILSVQAKEKGYAVQASINPKDVNENKSHDSFKKGTTVWANVVSELDHGLELSVGVNNCRVFLPSKNIDTSKTYEIGGPLYCVVHKCETAETATILTVSAMSKHLEKIEIAEAQNLEAIIPGTKVEFEFGKVTSRGISGKILGNFFAYIDETHIFSKVHKEKLVEGAPIPAYVLYVEPITKVTHLTLRGLEILPEPAHEVGKILPATITSVLAKGLFLKLGKNEIGFVTNRRLVNTLGTNVDILEAVTKKYPIGSKRSCRILEYNRMQQLYICTFEPNVIKEKLFNVGDLTEGQKVTITVKEIIPKGLIVTAGHVQGFVPNLHLSNTLYSDSIKAKFVEGAVKNARVLNITSEGNVIFTLKPGLVESENCLTNVKEAVPGNQYAGYVIFPKISGTSISFYGNTKAWIASRDLNSDKDEGYVDPRNYFFRGQVVNVWCLGQKNGKLQMSLNPPSSGTTEKKNAKRIRVDTKVAAIVTAIQTDGIDVEVKKHEVPAKIPLAHLSRNPGLCPELLRTYKVGDEISELVCLRNDDFTLLSKREIFTLKGSRPKLVTIRDLKGGMVLRCSFQQDDKLGIFVSLPLPKFKENVFIPNENLTGESKSRPKFEKYQCILARVVRVDSATKTVVLDARIPQVKNNDVNKVVKLLESTLLDIDRIVENGRENGRKLVEYKIGEKIKCSVKEIRDGGCSVSLPNGAAGTVKPHLNISNAKVGDVIEGVVLDYNFGTDTVEICLRNDIKQNVNKLQDGVLKKSKLSSVQAQILLITEHYVLSLLKDSQCNRQLAYLPLNFHENDQNGIKSFYSGNKVKVSIFRQDSGKIIGVPKKLVAIFEKDSKFREKRQAMIKKKQTKSLKQDSDETENAGDTEATNESDTNEEAEISIKEESDSEIEDVFADNNTMEVKSESESVEEESDDDEEIVAEDEAMEGESENESDSDEKTGSDNGDEEEDVDEVATKVNCKSGDVGRSAVPALSGVNSFYAAEDVKMESSSSDEETQTEEESKKKKLTSAEKAELAKIEEKRISKIEKELADPTATPQSAAQFDRVLLANPNSAELWLKYMAMHVASTELDKARAVGRRALEAINMSLVTEKFNVWMSLLNLENMYGTKDTFEKLLEEALKCNDSLKVYLNVIKMLASSGKLNEMEEKIKKVRAKEKQNTNMWLEVGQVYYSLGKFKDARNFKAAALKSIADNKRQFDLIMRFGIMEFQSGELEQAIANFETILSTYPTKVNIWIIYVDQLIKQKQIDLARKVLERGAKERFSVKTMKTIFQKFIAFEEQYGDAASVRSVKDQAKQYVSKIGGR